MAWTLVRAAALLATVIASPAALAGYSLAPHVTYPAGNWAEAVAIGDVNGDGRNDVVLTTASYDINSNNTYIYLQNAGGTLASPVKTSYLSPASRNGLALGDLNHDGRDDIVVGHGYGLTIQRWGPFRNGAVAWWLHASASPQAADDVVLLDVNRDGHLDVVSQSWSDGATVYIGDGTGLIRRKVRLATPAMGYNDLDTGDFNHDGHTDLVVMSGQGSTNAFVYYNDGTDDFAAPLEVDANPTTSETINAVGAGDFTGDGVDDLVLMSSRNSVSVFTQAALSGVEPPTTVTTYQNPNALLGRDLNRDGRDDLVVLHGGGALGFHLQGDAGLGPEVLAGGVYATWFNTQGLAAGDINGDNCDDIVVANPNSGLVVYAGRGCDGAPDLVPSLGLTANRLAVRLDNPGDAAALQPQVDVAITVANGTLVLGALPAGCDLLEQAPLRANVRCIDAPLAAGTSRTRVLSLAVSGGTSRNTISVTARASTPTLELRTDNNVATRRVRGAFGMAAPTLQAGSMPRSPTLQRMRLREAAR